MQQAKIQATLRLRGALYSCSIRHARDKGQAAVTASWKQPENLAGGQGGDSSSTGAPCVPCLLTQLPAAAARQMTAPLPTRCHPWVVKSLSEPRGFRCQPFVPSEEEPARVPAELWLLPKPHAPSSPEPDPRLTPARREDRLFLAPCT